MRPIIIMTADEISTSGEITSSFESISDVFTSYSELPSEGFNLLFKAQRYGKWFVLKGLKPEYQRKEVYTRLLTKEFELGVQMDHPNIARTFSTETDPIVGPCIVMEYVDGCTLKEFLRQKPSQKVRMKIVGELLSAMSYYHSKQIIHRDLKPDNILVTRNGHNVKIIDFGLADTDYHGIFKQPAGSNKYAAPEQVAGNVPLDCRADIYAFGKILRLLFPHAYGRIARKCTQENRERRFSNAEEVLQHLQRQKRTMPVIIAFACIVGLALGAWLLLRTPGYGSDDGIQNVDTQEIPILETEAEKEPVSDEVPAVSVSSMEPNRTDVTVMEKPVVTNDSKQLLSVEVRRSIEQSVDAVFQPFWDWNRAATARGVTSKDKLEEYVQSDFFKNNYEIRERHREAVVNYILQRYPQCESIRDSLTTLYNSMFVKKMVAVNNVVNGWQRDIR